MTWNEFRDRVETIIDEEGHDGNVEVNFVEIISYDEKYGMSVWIDDGKLNIVIE